MAIPREKGGSRESSPPGHPNGGQGTGSKLLTLAALSSLLFYKKRKGKGIAQNAGLVPRTRVLWKAKTAGQADSGLVRRRCAQTPEKGAERRLEAPGGTAAPTTPPQALPRQWWEYREPWARSSRAGSAHSLHHPSMSR